MAKVKRYEHYGEAYGFDCPGCDMMHIIPVTGERGWGFNHDLEKPTFTPSILARTPQGSKPTIVCHSFVRNGKIEFLNDCTHAMAGKTIELPDEVDQ
jgi:hypothetical protein